MPKKVSFVRGFRVPEQDDIDKALGDDCPFSNEFKATFSSLSPPTSELDWLANYKERGQTYDHYLNRCPYLDETDSEKKYIYLTLIDDKCDRSSFLDIERLIDYTQRFFQMDVKILSLFENFYWNKNQSTWICTTTNKNKSKRETKLQTRYNKETEHSQIYVQSILNILKRSVPDDARCLVAITLHDLYSCETDLFIAGLAQGNSRVAAFSFFRYDPRLAFSEEYWFDWKIKKQKRKSISSIILLRSCRLLTHEIGHLLGIAHCIYYSCLMNGSGHLQEDFSQPLFECPVDLRKLARLAGFDIIQRYEQLLDFATENEFEEEIEILNNRLEILKSERQEKPKRMKKK